MNRSIVILFFATLMLAACAEEAAVGPATSPDDSSGSTSVSLDGTWLLTDVVIEGDAVTLPRALTFTVDDRRINGNLGCNSFSGTIDHKEDGMLSIGPLTQTEIGCEHLGFEMAYTAALLEVDRWEAAPNGVAFVTDDTRLEYQPASDEA